MHEGTGETMAAQREQGVDPLPLNSSPKNPAQKEEGPFAPGNPINCFRK